MQEKEDLKNLIITKQKKLNSLLELTKAINNNFSKAALLKLFEFVLNGELNIERIALFVRGEEWVIEINEGNIEVVNKINVKEDLLKFQVIQNVSRFPGDTYKGFEYLIPIVNKKNILAYVLIGGFNLKELDSIDQTLNFIETVANFIIISLENKRLFKVQLEQERVSKEVELASQVQNMLIPSELPHNEFYDVAGHYQPHGSIGGDYYDFISIDESKVAFCICDVSGKGISAGMLMANVQAQLRSMLNKYDSLEQLVDVLNFKLFEITKGERYVTMFLGVFDLNTRELRFVNAGHNPIILHQNNEIVDLKKGCTILGAFDQLPMIEAGKIILEKNAFVLCYTDGLNELENELEEMFGNERLNTFVFQNHDINSQDFVKKLTEELIKFKGDNDYNDDVSVLACKFL